MEFTEKPTGAPGVTELLISEEEPYSGENFVRCEAPLVSVDGRAALADEVIRQIVRNWRTPGAAYAGFRFGPGGRRQYRFVTEKLVERLAQEAMREPFRPSTRQLERAKNICRFVEDLMDLLPREEI